MKCFWFLSIVFLFSCKSESSENFDWLIGNWERVNENDSLVTSEYWERNGDEYYGFGITTKGSDTTFQEHMKLFKKNSIWNLKVTGVNSEPTFFEMTTKHDNGFVVENEVNEFPKKIKYWFENDTLKATASIELFDLIFLFVKVKN